MVSPPPGFFAPAGSSSAFCGPGCSGPVPGLLAAALSSLGAASAGAAGSGSGASLCEFRKAMTFARSCGLLRPAKVILVPGANFFGLASQALILSQFHVPPTPERAGEKGNPWPLPTGSPMTPQRFGPSALAPPLSALWQAVHFLKTCSPAAASALAR